MFAKIQLALRMAALKSLKPEERLKYFISGKKNIFVAEKEKTLIPNSLEMNFVLISYGRGSTSRSSRTERRDVISVVFRA